MKTYDVVVVGGSAAGVTAAITARRHYPEKSVLLVRKEKVVQIPCGIPYIFGTVLDAHKNVIPDGALESNDVDLLVEEVTAIDRDAKTVTAGGQAIGYDRLVLAMGSQPLKPPIPGVDLENVYFARKDTDYLTRFLAETADMKHVVVVGGGFIGVEFADELLKRGIEVTVVEMLPYCLQLAFEEDLGRWMEGHLRERGVNIRSSTVVEEIVGDGKVTGVRLNDGTTLEADAVLVGIGVQPDIFLAEAAGLEAHGGGIAVDERQRTSDPHILAAGDCTAKQSFFNGEPSGLRLASIAAVESRIAGANLYEGRRSNPGVIGVFSTAVGERVAAVAGLGEEAAERAGFEVVTGEAEAPDRHPGGMPGMAMMRVKLVFEKDTGRLLGGMARGGPGVGEWVNMVSACIQTKMTADDLAQFQLGTHPAVTASPIAYQTVNAAEVASKKMRSA